MFYLFVLSSSFHEFNDGGYLDLNRCWRRNDHGGDEFNECTFQGRRYIFIRENTHRLTALNNDGNIQSAAQYVVLYECVGRWSSRCSSSDACSGEVG